jgi:polar amino acid transport system permease protein
MGELLGLLRFGPDGWGDELLEGTWLTVRLALATLPFGMTLGFLVALGKNSTDPVLRALCNAFTTVFRGLPELLTIFLVYFGGELLLQKVVSLFSEESYEVNKFLSGMFALGVVFAAYSSEVWLGAIRALSHGQVEAARSLGLSALLTLRLVTLPQLVRYALPGLSNNWLVLLKDTALVSVIALDDLLRITTIIVGSTKQYFFFYLVACCIYLALALVSSVGLTAAERRLQRGQQRS